ncbi:DegT/DnrJ/EryC1/StrS family aminotransferase [Leadbetterella byssophila]|uniref:DegT/DnrJ/EryC1/StrS aminotransferase n=1 Tax=Leadbetterella byssophila (strain DSM 17132 / JCM 16389 / KACC 11308 / NBRC 106382 / 4M15) TaxID=649349 RepID=E4RS31_LEAB4|nr:DegT/DnrJ/EryC1/StrS family aminotransferase [Leadbetterella byssophila]ADQ15847.1 DegT/DnrJ/EryC1/StrS aminotransferase [Leadbetterella byssophila DSM 17132]
MNRINVTKSFLPPKEEYEKMLERVWQSEWLTNNGPLLVELETTLQKKLDLPYFAITSNGTIAIQLAIKALNLSGEIITTPFSYCATTTSILWENLKPVFVDIREDDLNINADLVEAAITDKTSAILATHVYGNPCDVEKLESIGKKYGIKIIYDAAHAFGVEYKGKPLLSYGDMSTCSFHATKVFHTVEGGCVVCHDKELFERVKLMRSFGHVQDDYYLAGVNGKNSEFHAAMGLVNLGHLDSIIAGRKAIFGIYDQTLNWNKLYKPTEVATDLKYNYAYYPIVLEDEDTTLRVIKALQAENIYPRRYFYPTLNTLQYVPETYYCPVSESVSPRVISLPLYPDLDHGIVNKIAEIINAQL